ncbi:hypothetical protein, partial [Acetobacter pasteurianus]|uniref:hypothetical protein n=2 Tax=Acetobacter pasteurianus TaxID=438 RepID=UPI0011CE6109
SVKVPVLSPSSIPTIWEEIQDLTGPTPSDRPEAIMPLNAMVRSVGGSGYDVYQPAYSNPAWGVVGGAMGIAGLFFGGSNTPGSIAHKAREQFHDKSDYVGEQILQRVVS